MLYNAQRQRVKDWQPGQISTCPDCQQSLLPRCGDVVIWHWAHYPDGDRRHAPCGHHETLWHLAWKAVYDNFRNWTVETPVHGFRADAVNLHTHRLREFIHSLSPYYQAKHQALAALDFDIRWIFDGNKFVSRRKRKVKNGGIAGLLVPRAFHLHLALRRRCWVHYDHQIWKEWEGHDVWYPRDNPRATMLLAAFDKAFSRYSTAGVP